MRRFNNSIEITRRTLEKKEALILRLNKKPLSEADIITMLKYSVSTRTNIRKRRNTYWRLIGIVIGIIIKNKKRSLKI